MTPIYNIEDSGAHSPGLQVQWPPKACKTLNAKDFYLIHLEVAGGLVTSQTSWGHRPG